ncbi:MAG: glutamine--fructose-6-phosphate transaminase (isomerizing) [Watsoniomyces obsoletus]|nr:MAG: glutamine--fructose-6-phosphate transaminase (isomerizing) [Watsoniomyces obsoletus]
MSLFPAFPSSEFGPLFRLLDDYETHRGGRGGQGQGPLQTMRTFQPKFDVRETKDTYELHGELPGVDQRDIQIEFVDPHTLVIKGRIEREYHSEGVPPQGRITGEGNGDQHSHKATVEDDAEESSGQAKSGHQQQQVTKQDQGQKQVQKQGNEHRAKYWVSERSVGEFHRSFGFPTRVDQDNVKASLKNGILNISVPKAPAHQAKRINIE